MSKKVYDNQNNQSKTTTGLQEVRFGDLSNLSENEDLKLSASKSFIPIPLQPETWKKGKMDSPVGSILAAYNNWINRDIPVDKKETFNSGNLTSDITSTGCDLIFGFLLFEFKEGYQAKTAHQVIRNAIKTDAPQNADDIASFKYNGKHYVAIPQTCYEALAKKLAFPTEPNPFVNLLRDLHSLQREQLTNPTGIKLQSKNPLRNILTKVGVSPTANDEYNPTTAGHVRGEHNPSCTRKGKTNIPVSALQSAVLLSEESTKTDTLNNAIEQFVPKALNVPRKDQTTENKSPLEKKGYFDAKEDSWFSDVTAAIVLSKSGFEAEEVNKIIGMAIHMGPLLQAFENAAKDINNEKKLSQKGVAAVNAYKKHVDTVLTHLLRTHPEETKAALKVLVDRNRSDNVSFPAANTVLNGMKEYFKEKKAYIPFEIKKVSGNNVNLLERSVVKSLNALFEGKFNTETFVKKHLNPKPKDPIDLTEYFQSLNTFSEKFPYTLKLLSEQYSEKEPENRAHWLLTLPKLVEKGYKDGSSERSKILETLRTGMKTKNIPAPTSFEDVEKLFTNPGFLELCTTCEKGLKQSLLQEATEYQKKVLENNEGKNLTTGETTAYNQLTTLKEEITNEAKKVFSIPPMGLRGNTPSLHGSLITVVPTDSVRSSLATPPEEKKTPNDHSSTEEKKPVNPLAQSRKGLERSKPLDENGLSVIQENQKEKEEQIKKFEEERKKAMQDPKAFAKKPITPPTGSFLGTASQEKEEKKKTPNQLH